jgi:hypothetical protein
MVTGITEKKVAAAQSQQIGKVLLPAQVFQRDKRSKVLTDSMSTMNQRGLGCRFGIFYLPNTDLVFHVMNLSACGNVFELLSSITTTFYDNNFRISASQSNIALK